VRGDVVRHLALILQLAGAATDESDMESVASGQARRRRMSGAAMVVVMLILGISATAGATLAVARGQRRLATQEMDHYIDDISAAVQDELSHYGDALTDLAAGIGSQDRLTYADFKAMTAALARRRLPGASGVGFVVPATDREVASTQAYWRARGASGLSLYRTGTDEEHDFVIFARTLTGGAQNPGRDLSEIPEAQDALRIAKETGAFTVGRAHVLVRDRMLPPDQQQLSFTLATPIFGRPGTAAAATVKGWVVMGVRGTDFLTDTLEHRAQGALGVTLTDTADGGGRLADITGGDLMGSPELYRSRVMLVGQHTWRLTITPTTTLLSAADRRSTDITLIGGLLLSALLATLVGVLAGARVRAMDRVDAATAALRQDIERREALEHELQRLAFHDPLTGLANRSLFYDRVGHALRSHLRGDQAFAVFFIDLDGFKQVNDALGHSAGDAVLCEVAARLRECLRDSDTVARFGGDEFAVIVERLAATDDVHLTAERIVHAVQQPIPVGSGRAALVTASVGIALNRDGYTADDILREADLAMYTAKTTGKCRHVLAV
jgi:diguanylate cyclase (GGDEF)-like protein